ncbi:SGNH/GDSL hydrolase family protein [Blastococcus sp. SYSU D00820]
MRRLLPVVLAVVLLGAPGCGLTGLVDRADERTVAVFLGDSFTVGFGGEDGGYVSRTADRLDWTAVAEGQSGTGYVNPSAVEGQEPYGQRLASVIAEDPDVVVVQGSTNDVSATPAAVQTAARRLYADLEKALPDAQVLVLGPLSPPGVDAAAVRQIRDVLADAAEDAGLPYVDPIAGRWLTPPDGLFVDGVHPNDRGYTRMAEELARALRDAGF